MFTSKVSFASAALLIAVAMLTLPTKADRSFYAPGPVNYPGLLPRFGGGTQDGGSRMRPADDDLGTRFGDIDGDQQSRARPSTSSPFPDSRQSSRCAVPCYDCIVYISRTGQITRYNPARQNELVRY